MSSGLSKSEGSFSPSLRRRPAKVIRPLDDLAVRMVNGQPAARDKKLILKFINPMVHLHVATCNLQLANCLWGSQRLRRVLATALACILLGPAAQAKQAAEEQTPAEDQALTARAGYIIKIPLPLVGQRDTDVIQQIRRIAEAKEQGSVERPVVVLQFEPTESEQIGAKSDAAQSRGSQFERCLALARYLTQREAAQLRLVAFLPATVEGHAVLPVLACQEVYAAPGIELGRAAVDFPADATVLAAYHDVIARGRTNIPKAAIDAMLTPNVELCRLSTTDKAGVQFLSLAEVNELSKQGKVSEVHEIIWNGLGLAAFTAEQMRNWLWINPTVHNHVELAKALEVNGNLRGVQQLPREWKAAAIPIRDTLTRQRVNQIIRSLQDTVKKDKINLIVVLVDATTSQLDDAVRLADGLIELRKQDVYTIGIVQASVSGPIGLIPTACNETVLVGDATLGPDLSISISSRDSNAINRQLDHLSTVAERPLPLLSILADKDAVVNIYTHQASGRHEIFSERQVHNQVDRDVWIIKERLAGGKPIPQAIALQYGLVNAVEGSTRDALLRLGLNEIPGELSMPWLDTWIQRLVGQPWVPRLLLLVGMMALMVELGNPGTSLGALVSGLCFLGYFWVEGLNGNVEWLEILLFFGGLFALAIEVLVLPGFGLFGVTGLMMIFVSLVLAGQTFVWPSSSSELSQVASNLFWVAFMAFAGMIGLLLMHERISKLPLIKKLSLVPAGTDDIIEQEHREIVVNYDYLLGQTGLTTTRLNPSGKAQFGGDIVSVVGSGGLIDAGAPVQVVEVRGNLVIVEQLD